MLVELTTWLCENSVAVAEIILGGALVKKLILFHNFKLTSISFDIIFKVRAGMKVCHLTFADQKY